MIVSIVIAVFTVVIALENSENTLSREGFIYDYYKEN